MTLVEYQVIQSILQSKAQEVLNKIPNNLRKDEWFVTIAMQDTQHDDCASGDRTTIDSFAGDSIGD